MVKEHLLEQISEADLASESYRIYSTLDPELQRAAGAAVAAGAENLDKLLARRYAKWKKAGEASPPQVQIALVAMDPRTGEIRALVGGGRNYGESQLNHATAHRQPGSVFKPFVYAAAFDNAAEGMQPVITPLTPVVDSPTTFTFDNKTYTPNNFGEQFYGNVTVREALIHSMNVATVKVAEMIGYDRVVTVARQMGLGANIQATPAVALGAYEMTPIDVAAGYTIFATNGTRAEPMFLQSVIDEDGKIVEKMEPKTRPRA
jgi:penicillin-binding protein 1B